MEKFTFGDWVLDLENKILWNGKKMVPLTRRAFDVLAMLVKARGELVTKNQLLDHVWEGVVVEENNLQAQISTLRRKLGADRRLISTEFSIGYRFLGEISAVDTADASVKIGVEESYSTTVSEDFIGRSEELTQVLELLSSSRLVSLTGIGGIGKTALAKEVAKQAQTRYQDGTVFVELTKVPSATGVESAVLSALGFPSSFAELSSQDRNRLDSLNQLLIIDNCEHLINAAADLIDRLLEISSSITVLTTTQEALGVAMEQRYPLSPLSLPDAPYKIGSIDASPAVHLFYRRAQLFLYGYTPSDKDKQYIAQICRRLDGLPLAIELAASRVVLLSAEEILAGLTQRLRALKNPVRSAHERHRTLMAAIDWSFDLLGPEEQYFFSFLSVFSGEFTLLHAKGLAELLELEPGQVVDGIQGLLNKSLLQMINKEGEHRYYYLESVKLYAQQKLENSKDATRIVAAHAQLLSHITKSANEDWLTLASEEWRGRYEFLTTDVNKALDWTLVENNNETLGIDILVNASPFWIVSSMYDQGGKYITPLLSKHFNPKIKITDNHKMFLNIALGKSLTWSKGPVAEAEIAWISALELAKKSGNYEVQIQAFYGLWLYYLRTNRFETALSYARQLTHLAQVLQDYDAIATGFRLEGVSYQYLGNNERALSRLKEAIVLYEKKPSTQPYRFGLDQLVAARAFISRVYWLVGETEYAMQVAELSLERAYQLKHVCSICCALAEGSVMIAVLNRDLAQAEDLATELSQLSIGSGLDLWTTYSKLYLTWLESFSPQTSSLLEGLSNKIQQLVDVQLHWLYSPLLFDAIVNTQMDSMLQGLSFEKVMDTKHWATPIYLYHLGKLCDVKESYSIAIEKARSSQAYSWEVYLIVRELEQKGGTSELMTQLSSALLKVDKNPKVQDVQLAQQYLKDNSVGNNSS
ncbi:winged helix-turn-helix domain-containing protein [Vibrio harveyi]|uniref:winged helix-turn-helix domain-containing protein n=1 Tax=Vibrio harveyi TaxID=669 RepID=UPI002380A521|nr:winged helix-turn-helix domain-containing protein [Vibrio harveyi]